MGLLPHRGNFAARHFCHLDFPRNPFSTAVGCLNTPIRCPINRVRYRFCAENGAERHRLRPLGKLRAVSLSKRQAARRVAVATARTGNVTGDWMKSDWRQNLKTRSRPERIVHILHLRRRRCTGPVRRRVQADEEFPHGCFAMAQIQPWIIPPPADRAGVAGGRADRQRFARCRGCRRKRGRK